jgi:hypothetical protein
MLAASVSYCHYPSNVPWDRFEMNDTSSLGDMPDLVLRIHSTASGIMQARCRALRADIAQSRTAEVGCVRQWI